jgi:DNA primase
MHEQVMDIIQRYFQGAMVRGGSNVYVKCPFHKGGEERKPSLSISLENGLWNCKTGCGAGPLGKLLHMLGLTRDRIEIELKSIAPLLQANREVWEAGQQHFTANRDPFRVEEPLPEGLLGLFDYVPQPLVDKGFDVRLLRDRDIGFDFKAQRITYPIRDIYGTWGGVSGGAVLPGVTPKYRVYEGRRRSTSTGQWIPGDFGDAFDNDHPGYKFSNHTCLWGYERVYPKLIDLPAGEGELIVTEGFKACLWMIQSGFPNTVALMGSSLSGHQARLLHRFGGTVYLLLDNDDAGRYGANRINNSLWWPLAGRVRVVPYPEADLSTRTQPDDYTPEVLREMIQHATARIPNAV